MRPPTFLSFITSAAIVAVWTNNIVHGQISVGCFQNQLDSSTGGSDLKSYQDIYMSQGACTNYCRTSGTAYALTMDGSTCHCSNSAPLDSNKIDDAKCDKPCMGYPFEMCGGSSSRSIASVLLIGSSTAVPGAAGGGGSTSTANGRTGTGTTAPAGSESSKKSQNGNSNNNNNGGGGGSGASTTTTTTDNNGGKAFNTDTGMFPPPRPTTSPPHEHEHGVHDRDREGRLKKETGHLDASSDTDEDSSSGSGGGSSPGIIAASIAAIFGFAALFAVAFVFSKRRRQRLSQAAWTENMLLPSSLIHSSANDDQLEGHDYTRSSPIYHQHPNKQRDSIPAPIPPHNMHFPPPLHPRQGGPLHMSQPSYPPPPPMMGIPGGGGGGHYHSMRGNPYQPFPLPVRRLSQQQQQYDPHLLIEENLNHKEPIQASPSPPQFAPSFSRGPQSLQQAPPLPLGAIEHIRNSSEGRGIWEEEEDEDYERHDERSLSHHPSVRSIRHDRQERGSVDSTANSLRVVNPDSSS
ncbi:hypothetical protein K457DRAFT_903068 [Linnemannia elongata AG-77]|uniref:WSC domain-containing protein n=1 Tax=Linnemannia elongata AG-77 TaxID=1314771 RepID=A0A197K7H2_9FUNG|nr:hypothetical protein K457DRAFT_903068 [Linnemannia elongata AG-77]